MEQRKGTKVPADQVETVAGSGVLLPPGLAEGHSSVVPATAPSYLLVSPTAPLQVPMVP